MGVRITDLMDSYHDDLVLLPETNFPTAERTMELTMDKINQKRGKKRRFPKGLLIAAILILVFSITAGAVGYTVWDAAKADLGITEELPEYTEFGNVTVTPEKIDNVNSESNDIENKTPVYHTYEIPEIPLKDHLVDNAKIEVISTFCSGDNVTIYFEVSPVTPEMAEKALEENQGLNEFAFWEPACFTEFENTEGSHYGATQVEYNPEAQSVLIRVDVFGTYLKDVEEIAFGISWYSQTGAESEVKFYGAVEFPLTQAEAFTASLDIPVTNKHIEQAIGTIESVEVWAGNILVNCTVTPTNELCTILGDNAYQIICESNLNHYGNAESNYQYTDLDTYVYYGRSWDVSLSEFLNDAYLTLEDGTTYQIRNDSNVWLSANTSNVDTGSVTETIELSTPIDLSRVIGITINDVYFTLSKSSTK